MVRFASVIAALALFASSAAAEEGMWTFDNFPAARMRSEVGWAPDQAWLDRVLAGSARIEGVCSAANVSAQGLVMTNHHCIRACIQDLSTPTNNYYQTGFLARTGAEERRCTAMAIQRLISVRDVTREIDAATLNTPPEGFTRARDAAIAQLESACKGDDAAKRCEVVALYQGGRYALHEYKRYEDVRLVFVPEAQMADFGGDPDNFNFPRYAFDVAFIRLYENGAPAATPQHLSLRFTPLAENEIVLVSGNPGETSRLLTVDQLAFQRDFFMPWRLATLSELRGRLLAYAALGPNQARAAADQIQNVENTFKAFNGRRLALVDAASFARVEAAETDLRARVERNRAAIRDAGDAWNQIAGADRNYRTFFLAQQYLESRAGGGSRLFSWARDLVRGAAEREKPAGERLARYAPARLGALEHTLLADRPVDAGLEELLLGYWATKLREYLTVDDPLTQRVLGRESPEELAHRLIAGTKLADPAERARLWSGGQAAIAASTDPMIVFARSFDADARALQLRYQREIEGVITPAQQRIAQARFRAFGDSLYPDATFTARLSYGRVLGLTEPSGRVVGPFTRFEGLFARATGQDPFALSARWSTAQSSLDPQTIFDVASSNDIIGGNSGSPLIDREGRVVGAVFDGNIYSLGGEYFYDGALNRTVSVATTAIREALTKVYGADALVAELEAQ